jgi:hypothetical protein
VVKGYVGRRPSTWYSLTEAGGDEFARYRQALAAIVDERPARMPSGRGATR